LPALDSLRTLPLVDAKNVVMMGQSAGGYSVMHIGTLDVPGLKGIINFSGGRTDATGVSSASDFNKTMVNGFEAFGAAAKYPVLMIFAEQDSRYSVNTIKASHQAFVAAGGAATLVLGPAAGSDGHFVYRKPEVWRDDLKKFLAGLEANK
jgi:dienelactone hydrolase